MLSDACLLFSCYIEKCIYSRMDIYEKKRILLISDFLPFPSICWRYLCRIRDAISNIFASTRQISLPFFMFERKGKNVTEQCKHLPTHLSSVIFMPSQGISIYTNIVARELNYFHNQLYGGRNDRRGSINVIYIYLYSLFACLIDYQTETEAQRIRFNLAKN